MDRKHAAPRGLHAPALDDWRQYWRVVSGVNQQSAAARFRNRNRSEPRLVLINPKLVGKAQVKGMVCGGRFWVLLHQIGLPPPIKPIVRNSGLLNSDNADIVFPNEVAR